MVPVVLLQLYDAQIGNLPSLGSELHVQHTVHTYSASLQGIPRPATARRLTQPPIPITIQ